MNGSLKIITSSLIIRRFVLQMNQQCKVCGEPAAGFHFGAFTCEGCKVIEIHWIFFYFCVYVYEFIF